MKLLLLCLTLTFVPCTEDEFSGPQPGEPLPSFKANVVFGPQKGKEINLHEQIKDNPNLVLFVHEVTRPSVGLTRTVCNYANRRSKDGFITHVVFLTSDPTETENWMKRAQRALPQGINVAISGDGIEGPGAFGLNRKMQITALISKNKKVVDNFAIVQPSVQADANKLCQAIAKILGDKRMPSAKELGINPRGRASGRGNGKYEQLMRPFIQKSATAEQTTDQAKKIEAEAEKDPQLKKRIHEVANRIIDAGKLENYGNATTQDYLKKWAKEFGKK